MIRKAIAGIDLLIEGDTNQEIREDHSDPGGFFSQGKRPEADHRIHVRVCGDPMPDFDMEKSFFAADDVWSVYQDPSFYWIVLKPPALENPLWAARFDHEFSRGTVFCGEKLKQNRNGRVVLKHPVGYPLDQILMMHVLARIGGMLIHAAGWAVNDSGWIFAGKSGAGKSTISNLIVEATGGTFLSDDRIIIRKIGREFLMYGTPWPGDAGYAVNASVPLKGIFFLSKGEENSIRALTPADAIARLMPVASILWYDREKVELMMTFCDDLLSAIPMYELTFVPDQAVVSYLETFINDG